MPSGRWRADMVAVMQRLGFQRFAVAGHDRGGRVAYRLALDHPDRVERLAVLDVLPIETVWERADDRLALGFWPWSLLAQPEPLPERILAAAAEAIIDNALQEWGSAVGRIPGTRSAPPMSRRFAIPRHAHAICEEYRAAASIDREHDRQDRADGRRIACPVLALWSAAGAARHLVRRGWRTARAVAGMGRRRHRPGLDGGHFFPEELPEQTAEALGRFFGGGLRRITAGRQPRLCPDFSEKSICKCIHMRHSIRA